MSLCVQYKRMKEKRMRIQDFLSLTQLHLFDAYNVISDFSPSIRQVFI